MILIQGAMTSEIDFLVENLEEKEELEIEKCKFYKGKYSDKEVLISKTNIGLVEASYATMVAIKNFKIDTIINQGTAGAAREFLKKYDIVVGTSSINGNSFLTGEKDIGEGSDPFEWKLLNFIEGEDKIVEEKASIDLINKFKIYEMSANMNNIYYGKIGSGDFWNRELDRVKYLAETYDLLVEEMETYAVYTIANKQSIPCISIRVISDNALTGESFDKETGKYSQEKVIEFVKEYM